MTDISYWYNNIPLLTKYWLSLTFGFSLLARVQILPAQWLYLDRDFVFYEFQVWRLVTSVFYNPTSFHFLFCCYLLYKYSLRLETEDFNHRPGDYVFLLIFNWACCVVIGLLFEVALLVEPMVLSVLYIWCQLNKEVIINFWFGTQFKAIIFPWILLAFNCIVSNGIATLIGIFVGHIYYFFKFKYPQEIRGASYLETPSFIKSYFPDRRGNIHGMGFRFQNTRAEGNHSWGRGQQLGRG